MPSGTWNPTLEGNAARRAGESLDRIAADLRDLPPFREDALFGASLADGDAGLALFWAYHEQARPGQGGAGLALRHLERAYDRLAGEVQLPGLFTGFTGVAWVVEHLREPGDDPAGDPADDPNIEVDELLQGRLERGPWTGDYDLVTGLAGLGAYALERLPGAAAERCLAGVVARLAECAEPQETGLAWPTPERRLAETGPASYPNGRFNLGVAHGVPGVIPVLARAAAAGIDAARPLLEGAVDWLLADGSGFDLRPARSAWCYGDPGIAAALLTAARAADEPAWEARALALARAAAARPPAQTGVRDACLCHGAAGLGHLFNRLHQATGDPVLGAAARAWLERALEAGEPGPGATGIGGFRTWGPGPDGEMGWRAEPGLMTGAAGIGLVLLAAVSGIEPAWDRLLQLPAAGGRPA